MFAIYSDARAMRYWSTPPHDDRRVTQALLDRRLAHWKQSKTNFQFEHQGKLIGNVGNFSGDEIGYILAPDVWRHGFMREALGTVLAYLWRVTDHARLTADIDPLKAAFVGLLTAFGFAQTRRAARTFCINGNWSDSVYLALERPTSHDAIVQ